MRSIVKRWGAEKKSLDEPSLSEETKPQQQARIRASKLEYKTVNQIWDKKNYGHKLVENLDADQDEDIYEEFIFIERRAYDEKNMYYNTFVDVKSEPLRDVLRKVLHGINEGAIREEKPKIRVEVLYHYLPQLEASKDDSSLEPLKVVPHLELLVRFLKSHFQSTIKNLPKHLEHGEITFDLLWALFPPMTTVFAIDEDSEQPRCVHLERVAQAKDRISDQKYLVLRVHHIDHNGKSYAKVSDILKLWEFSGVKSIKSLDAFPLKYHENMEEVKSKLIERGRRFASLAGVYHRGYSGLAHVKRHQEKTFKFTVRGRLMVDPLTFREYNPNYPSLDDSDDEEDTGNTSHNKINIDSKDMKDEDLLICNPTVFGYSLDKRSWAEFAVSRIEEIQWTNLPFDSLVIPDTKKKMLQALVQEHTKKKQETSFDDVIEGKGKGLIILLHGPPGVGKTLTAEAISEHGHRPLIRVTAGDLGLDVFTLEESLSRILDLAARWKAILLLDEADVFLEARERQYLQQNMLVTVFLRQLEYFQGVMLLTTNRVTTFDDAVQSRIHLGIKYDVLKSKARAEIWTTFINQAKTESDESKQFKVTANELDDLARRDLNGRQIKNTVRMAYALATAESRPLKYSDLIDAIEANADFDDDFKGGAGHGEAMRAYQ